MRFAGGAFGIGAVNAFWLALASCSDSAMPPAAELDAGDRGSQRQPVATRDSAVDADAGAKAAPARAEDAGTPSRPQTQQNAPKPPVVPREHDKDEHTAADGDDDAGVLAPSTPDEALLAAVGERLFQDRSLSVTSTQSCATCHASEQAFTGSADHDEPFMAVSRGAKGDVLGTRNAPTAMYAQYNPAFQILRDEKSGRYTPTGGLFWDGRASSLSEQAAAPFINPREMALPDVPALIERVRKTAYAAMFDQLYGANALRDVPTAYRHVTDAIAAFESTPRFHPFSSKFDAYLRGQGALSEQEQQGFDLFKDPEKANCIACHAGDTVSQDPQAWLFTNFGYESLAVPRNPAIVDNAVATYFDLGLCQSAALAAKIPAEVDDKAAFTAALCGAFKVPTLRNVAKTQPYMHNGFFAMLRDAVEFHVTRETEPSHWYMNAEYDDLPEQYWSNVNTHEAPFDRTLGEEPRLTADEIDAVVAFLLTLNDGQ